MYLRSFRLNNFKSCEVLSSVYGIDSQMVVESFLSLVLFSAV